MCTELGFIDESPTTVYCDNESAIKLATNEKSVHRTRHMAVRAAFTREQIQNDEIVLKHVRTDLQDADLLTKPMVSHKFMANRNRLMHFLSLLSLLAVLAGGEHFEPATPLIWIPTNYYVDTGITEYEIDKFTYVNLSILRDLRAPKKHPGDYDSIQSFRT